MGDKTPFEIAIGRLMMERFRLINRQRPEFTSIKALCPDRVIDKNICTNKGHSGIPSGFTPCKITTCPWLNPVVRFGFKKLRGKKRVNMCSKCSTAYVRHIQARDCCEDGEVVKIWLVMD